MIVVIVIVVTGGKTKSTPSLGLRLRLEFDNKKCVSNMPGQLIGFHLMRIRGVMVVNLNFSPIQPNPTELLLLLLST